MALLWYTGLRLINLLFLWRLSYVNGQSFFPKLHAWDGEWMLNLAANGYQNQPPFFVDARGLHLAVESYAFFPGYPLLIRGLHFLHLGSYLQVALLINWLAGYIFTLGILKLGKLIFPSSTLKQSIIWVILVAASPLAIVFNLVYTEALFCALAAWALYFLLTKKWWLAGVLILLAGWVRPTASALIFAMLIFTLVKNRRELRAWLGSLLSTLGLASYLLYVGKQTGSLTGWFHIQNLGWNTKFDFGKSTLQFLNYTICTGITFVDFIIVLAIIISLWLMLQMLGKKYPLPLVMYSLGVLATVLLSNGLMSSRPRLLLVAFPLALPLVSKLQKLTNQNLFLCLSTYIIFGSWFGAYILVSYPYAI